ncbi:MAG TPA: hypothetical protein ENN33_02350, partial [Ignavibacteria bacterium]|nr:hypothetical protein [Ignavibacteria bacterium]
MNKVTILTLLFIIILSTRVLGQLTLVSEPNMHSESDIYKDSNSKEYSKLIVFQFKEKMAEVPKGVVEVNKNSILDFSFKYLLG